MWVLTGDKQETAINIGICAFIGHICAVIGHKLISFVRIRYWYEANSKSTAVSLHTHTPETCLTLLFPRVVRSSSRRNLEPKRAENLRLRFASSAHLLQQTDQKAKIMAEIWRQLSKHLLRKSSFKRV